MKKRSFAALLAALTLFAGVTTAITAETESSATAIAPTLRQQSDDAFDGGLIERSEEAGGRPSGYNCYEYGKSVEISQEAFSPIPDEELSADADCEIDLIDRRFGSRKPDAVQMFASDQSGQAVVKVVLDPAKTEFTKARFELHYGDEIEGWTLNIGDSVSNNGHGGDGADQTRDSEVQILGSDLALFGDDTAPTGEAKILARSTGLAVPGAVVVVEVSNNQISWHNDKGVDGVIKSEYVFSLAGQGDAEGQPNYDIYAGFNRVVVGGRVGKGLKRVKIKLFH
ncbi:MAG: hypothetical protein CVV42_18005 [Candidatus Riflebacteria bacterium HGW-Riflebacteria-2]|jgi:hypothetical protein|nr:MAG: hypothetical protein CVV42_18005 [Candidatus Riflebacteria bacterium HGW-Riflebacteria-2]